MAKAELMFDNIGGGGAMTVDERTATLNVPVVFDDFVNGVAMYYSATGSNSNCIVVVENGVLNTSLSYMGTSGYFMFSYNATTHTLSFTLSYSYARKDVVAIYMS